MNELALFAGAGGGILGGCLLGWRTVCAVEIDAYAASVLIARQNDGILPPFPIWDDVRTFDGRPWRGIVDVVSGGFPCQDISCAGRGGGIGGERSGLWREMARIIGEVRPRYVLVENSPILTSRGLGRVLGDLAALGYDAEWGVLGAIDAGAPHRRERIWIMGIAHSGGRSRKSWGRAGTELKDGYLQLETQPIPHSEIIPVRPGLRPDESSGEWRRRSGDGDSAGDVSDADREHEDDSRYGASTLRGDRCPEAEIFGRFPDANGVMRDGRSGEPWRKAQRREVADGPSWWLTEPDVGRVADGVAARVDRLKAIGNGQVPLVAATAWQIIGECVA